MQSRVVQIRPENLLIDLQNPRYDPRKSQREALETIAHNQDKKLVNLAEDIIDKGFNESDLPIVTSAEGEEKIFIVMEGNRRVAALKLLLSMKLVNSLNLPQRLTKKWKELNARAKGRLPSKVFCVVMSREDSTYWIQLKHTGENDGLGVVPWDGRAKHRFRGNSPALQALELVENSTLIDQATRDKLPKIAITNIERILGTPDSRAILGVEVNNRKLALKSPEDETLARLSIVVSDVAHGRVKVTNLDTKEQRIEYARSVVSRPLPKPHGTVAAKAMSAIGTSKSEKPVRRISPDRKALIPHTLKIAIPQTRINKIYWELQSLNIEKFLNSCSVMFRVFVEMSVDDFAQRKGISLLMTAKPKPGVAIPAMIEMSLRKKLTTVSEYLEKNGHCTKDELRGVRSLIANHEHVLSVDGLNAYVHNKDYSPSPSDLKSSWDNVQVFIQCLWTV
jgi:hypothetical protein